MTTPDPHTLNARLAEIIGMDLLLSEYDDGFPYWQTTCEGEVGSEWDPCHNPAQMEIVKGWLRKAGYGYETAWFPPRRDTRATVFWYIKDEGTRYQQEWGDSELLSLALAICAAIPKEKT